MKILTVAGTTFVFLTVALTQSMSTRAQTHTSPEIVLPKTPSAVRDAEAIATVNKAISALGGAGAISRISDLTLTGTMDGPENSTLKNGTFLWKISGGEVRTEANGSQGASVVVSGHGRPAYTRDGQAYRLPAYMSRSRVSFQCPGALLLEHLQNDLATIEMIHDPDSAHTPGVRLRTSLISDPKGLGRPPLQWTFDPATGLPVHLEYWIVVSAMPYQRAKVAIDMASYRNYSGVLLPSVFATYTNGGLEGTFHVASAVANQRLANEEFDLLPREVLK